MLDVIGEKLEEILGGGAARCPAVAGASRHDAPEPRRGTGAEVRATVVARVGNLAKMAAGSLQTHVSRSQLEGPFSASSSARCSASPRLAAEIEAANTARHALELTDAAGLKGLCDLICTRSVTKATLTIKRRSNGR